MAKSKKISIKRDGPSISKIRDMIYGAELIYDKDFRAYVSGKATDDKGEEVILSTSPNKALLVESLGHRYIYIKTQEDSNPLLIIPTEETTVFIREVV